MIPLYANVLCVLTLAVYTHLGRAQAAAEKQSFVYCADKNYVEEEKRIAREHGCYHGFDS